MYEFDPFLEHNEGYIDGLLRKENVSNSKKLIEKS